jgi:tryptophan-rich sensory protein
MNETCEKCEKELKRTREVEFVINKNLYIVCGIITVITMAMVLIEFFERGSFPPPGINFFYVGVLFLYSVHKEMLRWLDEKRVDRRGEVFVYLWITLTVILYIIDFIKKGYYTHSSNGSLLNSLSGTTLTTLEVCAIFILTKLSKVANMILEKRKK